MKRFVFGLGMLLLSVVMLDASAQNSYKIPDKYVNLNYSSQSMTMSGLDKADGNMGGGLTIGHTFYIMKDKPVANMIRFGIDATWFDLNYAGYKMDYWSLEDDEMIEEKIHQLEIGMQVGPSVTVSPIEGLNINAYFRFAPSFSAVFFQEQSKSGINYAPFFVTGASVNYRFIGLGFEKRWGKADYKDNEKEDGEEFYPFRSPIKTNGMRVYLSFRY